MYKDDGKYPCPSCPPCPPCPPTECVYKPDIAFMPEYARHGDAYVPFQYDTRMYSEKEALQKGTAFPVLYSPYSSNVKGGQVLCPL